MTLVVGIDGHSHRQQAPLSRRWNLGFNLITAGFCIICALFSLDVRRSAWDQARVSAANLVAAPLPPGLAKPRLVA
jgi:hypothetical protein